MFTAYSFRFWPNLIACLLGHAWCMVGVRHLIYEDPFDQQLLFGYFFSAVWLVFHCVIIDMVINTGGHMFLESEMPRIDNNKLLDDMKEAVYIVDEEEGVIHFQNRKANALTQQLSSDTQASIFDKNNQFDFSRKSFAVIDKKVLKEKQKETDALAFEKVLASKKNVSMKEIIDT